MYILSFAIINVNKLGNGKLNSSFNAKTKFCSKNPKGKLSTLINTLRIVFPCTSTQTQFAILEKMAARSILESIVYGNLARS